MKYFLPALLFVSAIFFEIGKGYAQPNLEWKECYGTEKGEYFTGIVDAHGGVFVFAGRTDSCIYSGDYQVIKIDDTEKYFGLYAMVTRVQPPPEALLK